LLKSSLFDEKIKAKILLGVDSNVFKPGNINQARKEIGLPLKKKIVFIGASNIKSRRKGYNELISTLCYLKEILLDISNIHLVIAGRCSDDLSKNLQFNYTLLGHLDHEKLAKAFQATDLFLCPSIEDSGPMMINQSIMCGTPVVSFEMGVALDLVITGKTGYRAELGDTEDLAKGVKYILQLSNHDYNKISENCRSMGLQLMDYKIQAARFLKLFNLNYS